ncbi:hypothetical protein ACSVIJ_05100 [Pseudomonas sp. NCHU5208]|uniref:hypothetical protein n=1 Tax=unclassified Pseudomonas TaxID=196821 RepID=UPI003F967D1E
MSQMQFMGERPAGWIEEQEARKAQRRRQKQRRIGLAVSAAVLLIGAAWLVLS